MTNAKSLLRVAILFILAASIAALGLAQEEAKPAPAWVQGISLNGFLSTTYSYNFNHPASGTNQYRVFDFDDNTFKIDVVELVVQKAVAKTGDTGFRFDLTAGSSIPRVAASAGLFRDSDGKAQDFDVHQAYVSWIAPVGSGLRFDLGKFLTYHGYEVLEGYDGYNDNTTRSFILGFALPGTHTGLKASYALTQKATMAIFVVNGWDNAKDNNTAKSIGAQLALTPKDNLSIYLNTMTGPEKNGNNRDRRNVYDMYSIWKATPSLTFAFNLTYGVEQNTVSMGSNATWKGAAVYMRYNFSDKFSLALRGERFDDVDGSRTGVVQKLSELTLTPEYRVSNNLVLRGDLRLDTSNKDVFEKRSAYTNRQPTVIFNAIYLF